MKLKNKFNLIVILISTTLFLNWGWQGHRIINFNTILTALPEMNFFTYWADSLADRASDADYRKSSDPNEAPKHYIDIDNYPEFVQTGMISQDFDSLVAKHGYNFVIGQGILPWAILNTIDSLQNAFVNGNWHKAILHASDLGHYIGDNHMPLHLTRNYNGQYTGQNGIHSRYESSMISRYLSQIIYDGDTLHYIDNLSDYVFNIIYNNYVYVDSILLADGIATAFVGNTTSTAYYEKLWELTKSFTIPLFKSASYKLTCLIYTAWINAGSPVTGVRDEILNHAMNYELFQNYPNPFNPTTKIKCSIPSVTLRQSATGGQSDLFVTLKIYDILGNEIQTLVNEKKSAGSYELEFNASELPSGIYFYKLTIRPSTGSGQQFVNTRKMVLLK